MKKRFPLFIGLLVGFVAVFVYSVGFSYMFMGHPYGSVIFYGGLSVGPLYMVFALLTPRIFSVKSRALRRNWRLSVLMMPMGVALLWLFTTVVS